MSKRSVSEVYDDISHVKVEDIVHGMHHGYVGFPSSGGIVGFSKLLKSLSTKVVAMVAKGGTN